VLGDKINLLDSGMAIANRVASLIKTTRHDKENLAVSYTAEVSSGLYKALTSYGFTSVNHITG
jgi:hypothetical protein